ncbi:hypothetical protein G7046_g3848 [Stylonectria norvegica]|nr:hypothetical protein G7046_g3848 [Stylonectria norvegica]
MANARALRSRTTIGSFAEPPKLRRKSHEAANAKDYGDEDVEGIFAQKTAKRPQTKTGTRRSSRQNNGRATEKGKQLESKSNSSRSKRKASVSDLSKNPSKRPRTLDRDNFKEVEEEELELEIEVQPDDDDDESAPQDPGFYDGINRNANIDAEQPRGPSKAKSLENEEDRVELTAVVEGSRTPAEEPEDQDNEEDEENGIEGEEQHEGEQQQDGGPKHTGVENEEQILGEEPSLTAQTQPKTRRKGNRRQSKKTAYDQDGYQEPTAGSPELGSDVRERVFQAPKHSSRTPRIIAQKDQDAQAQPAASISKTQELASPNPSEAEDQNASEYEGEDASEIEASVGPADDSIVIEPPGPTEEVIKVEMKTNAVEVMELKMSHDAWTGDESWKEDFLLKEEESEEDWFKRHKSWVHAQYCDNLFKHLFRLWGLCHGMPHAPDFEAQGDYLRENITAAQETVNGINHLVDAICKRMGTQLELEAASDDPRRKWARRAVKCLYRRIIPMLVLVQNEAVKAGGLLLVNGEPKILPPTGEFTSSTLNYMVRIQGWMERLYNTMNEELEVHPYQPKRDESAFARKKRETVGNTRAKFTKQMRTVKQNLEMAMRQLDDIAKMPQRLKEAAASDMALRLEAQRKKEERRLADDKQMQLFVNSTQPRDVYFERYGGWYLWEDDRLLRVIRKVLKLNARTLVQLVPDRTAEEVEQRVRDLKERMRRKYEAQDIEPPQWCYYHGNS